MRKSSSKNSCGGATSHCGASALPPPILYLSAHVPPLNRCVRWLVVASEPSSEASRCGQVLILPPPNLQGYRHCPCHTEGHTRLCQKRCRAGRACILCSPCCMHHFSYSVVLMFVPREGNAPSLTPSLLPVALFYRFSVAWYRFLRYLDEPLEGVEPSNVRVVTDYPFSRLSAVTEPP